MYNKISRIDQLTRPDHYYISDDDDCFYFGEYTARKGFAYSDTNQLILNIKKTVDRVGTSEYRHKLNAISLVASNLHNLFARPEQVTFVPVPPSKCKTDPLYDDRLIKVLDRFKQLNSAVDFRELIIQSSSTVASHNSDQRPSPENILELYSINEGLIGGMRTNVFIFDDMLTTGSHYKAVQKLLLNGINNVKVYGVFIARRAPEAIDWDFDLE